MNQKYHFILCEASCLLILAIVYLPWFLLKVMHVVVPHIRGLFCDDSSIRYPFHPSTVPSVYVYVVGLLVNFTLISYSEVITKRNRTTYRRLGLSILNIYRHVVVFMFGYGALLSTVNILKYSVGRLRPHFLDVCLPPTFQLDDATCKVKGHYVYTTAMDKYCSYGSITYQQSETRLSFPSGHAAMSFFFAIYISILLQRLKFTRSPVLLRPCAQYVCVMAALYVACSRVTDMKHHLGDVVFGSAIGISIAAVTAIYTRKAPEEDKSVPAGGPSLELSRSEYSIHTQYG